MRARAISELSVTGDNGERERKREEKEKKVPPYSATRVARYALRVTSLLKINTREREQTRSRSRSRCLLLAEN